jgi:four helix bundle protein
MIAKFRTLQLAVDFHRECVSLRLPKYLRDQLLRASSSVAFNLAEGSGKPTGPDKRTYYFNALGSLRECQVALQLATAVPPSTIDKADHLAASIWRLCQATPQ